MRPPSCATRLARLEPSLIVTTTAFAAGGSAERARRRSMRRGVPVLQVVSATTRRAAWRDSAARARRRRSRHARRAARTRRPHSRRRDRLQGSAAAAGRACLHRARKPSRAGPRRDGRRPHRGAGAFAAHCRAASGAIAVLMPDYPGAPGRTGYAVGLDVPASVHRAARRSRAPPATRSRTPDRRRARCSMRSPPARMTLRSRSAQYRDACWRACRLHAVARLQRGLGRAGSRSRRARRRAFASARKQFGNVIVALAARSRPRGGAPRRLSRSVAAAAPRAGRVRPVAAARREASMRSSTWARTARSNGCPARRWRSPRNAFRKSSPAPLPVIYPFIVSNPGEAAQAKRRIAARDHRPSAAAARRRRPFRRRARARTAGRRICAGRRARPPPPRAAGAADRRDRAAHRLGARGRRRRAPTRPTTRCAASMPGCAISRTSPSRTACTFTAARPQASDDPRMAGERRSRTRGAARRARRPPRRAGPGRLADARAARRAADRPQSLHRRSAHLPTPTAMDLGRLAADEVVRAHLQTPRRDAARAW